MPEYFIRITPYDACTLDDVERLFIVLKIDKYVVSYEEASRPHFHSYLQTSYTPERLRYQLKSKLSGQVYISGREVQSKVKTIAYTIKDGNYRLKNINIDEYLMAKQVTHAKPSFDKELKAHVSLDWKSNQKYELVDGIISLYVKYNRKFYVQHIKAIALTALLKDTPYRRKITEQVVADL